MGIDVLGMDAIPALIEQAQAKIGQFEVLTYEAIAAGMLRQTFDLVVANFSLLGKESVQGLFATMPSLLNPGGYFIVQTIHPVCGCGDRPYQDGWREGSWHGFSTDFTDPAPWYFRTIESWVRLYVEHGLMLQEIREPLHPHTRQPASVILIGQRS